MQAHQLKHYSSLFARTHNLPKFKHVYTMPPLAELPAYWQDYFKRADVAILESKFDGSSIYSIIFNAMAALENKRSNHNDYQKTIEEIYAPLLGTLLGTCQLKVEDWVFSAITAEPDRESKIYKYICETGIWNKAHVLLHAYSNPDCTKVLTKDDFYDEPVISPSLRP